ncbi:MAG: TolC family protein [Candidatus Margulisiibacteriota bacterium]
MSKLKFFAVIMVAMVLLGVSSDALTLRESVNIAIKNHPSVLAAQKKVDAADAKVSQAVGALLPTLKLDGTYGKAYTQPSTVQFTTRTATMDVTQTLVFGTDAAQGNRSLTASLSQPVFVAALFPGYGIARKNADASRADLRKAVLDAAYNVAQAYYNVIKAQKMIDVAKESRQMADSHFKQINAMLAAGTASKADLLRTEVQVENYDLGLIKTHNALELARAYFNNALGVNLEEKVSLIESELTGTVAHVPTYKELLDIAFQYRPDWQAFLLGKGMSEDNLTLAKTAYLPTVMLSANAGNRINEYPSYKSDVNSWTVTGAASWTMFDGFGIQNRVREAAANLASQEQNEAQVRNNIALEVRDAYLNLTNALETIDLAKKTVESAQESYKVSSQRFLAGAGTNLEVLDAQVSFTQAKVNYLQALFDVEIARAKVDKVVGKEVI